MDDLKNLLNRALFEERKALAEILKASQPTADSIVDRLCEKSQDTASYVSLMKYLMTHPSYQKIVRPFQSDFCGMFCIINLSMKSSLSDLLKN